MKLEKIKDLTEDLIGKEIFFTYHNRAKHIIERMPGRVVKFYDGIVEIDDRNIYYEDTIEVPPRDFDLDDVTDVILIDNYNKDFMMLLDDYKDEDIVGKKFTVTFVDGTICDAVVVDDDSLPALITLNINDEVFEYPFCLIKEIK